VKPLAQGYASELITLDERMVAIGRPAIAMPQILKSPAVAMHRAALEAWENANPDAAREWALLNAEYADVETRLEALKFEEAKQVFTFERLLRLGCPRRCVDAVRSPRAEPALKKARDFSYDAAWSLVLLGGPGTGKSTAATWLCFQYTTRQNARRVQWVDASTASQRQLYGEEADVRRAIARKTDILVIDDVLTDGRLKLNPAWLAWLEDVLGSRADNSLKTIVTSNASKAELESRLTPRLVDRLRMGMWFGTGDESMRGQS